MEIPPSVTGIPVQPVAAVVTPAPMQTSKRKLSMPLVILLTMAITAVAVGVIVYGVTVTALKDVKVADSTANTSTTTTVTPTATTPDKYTIRYVTAGDNKSDVFAKNLTTGVETKVATVTDAYTQAVHSADYVNNTLVIDLRPGYTDLSSTWTDELWTIDSTGKSTKIYSTSNTGVDFKVDPTGAKVVVLTPIDNHNSGYNVLVMDLTGKVLKTMTGADFHFAFTDQAATTFNLLTIAQVDASHAWITANFTYHVGYLTQLSLSDYTVTSYDVNSLNVTTQSTINSAGTKLAFVDSQVIVAQGQPQTKAAAELFIYDFATKQKVKVTESSNLQFAFNLNWASDTSLSYTDPAGGTKTYSL